MVFRLLPGFGRPAPKGAESRRSIPQV